VEQQLAFEYSFVSGRISYHGSGLSGLDIAPRRQAQSQEYLAAQPVRFSITIRISSQADDQYSIGIPGQ
jgi:hypothetical protein